MKNTLLLFLLFFIVACEQHEENMIIELKKSSILANKVEIQDLEGFIKNIDPRDVNSLVIMLDNDANPMDLKDAISLAKAQGIQNISVAAVDP